MKYIYCEECGQPMLPSGAEKKENEFDHASGCPQDGICSDCPPVGYPTDKTRCADCPRAAEPVGATFVQAAVDEEDD